MISVYRARSFTGHAHLDNLVQSGDLSRAEANLAGRDLIDGCLVSPAVDRTIHQNDTGHAARRNEVPNRSRKSPSILAGPCCIQRRLMSIQDDAGLVRVQRILERREILPDSHIR
jgi:hypothetical protein